ncbi:hypothetical protein [Streptomyces sp. CBMA29]|uniref:hypothetical protein n=1 Tax=Streptomyces sp. CBMA29 TaxID=1896314 RepID=UPI001661E978|nr:hypothetical protein [Streptomyces sp. CBMA29]
MTVNLGPSSRRCCRGPWTRWSSSSGTTSSVGVENGPYRGAATGSRHRPLPRLLRGPLLPVAFELPADADDRTREELSFLYGGVIYQLGDSLLGLRPVASDRFSEDRVGLDHVSFAANEKPRPITAPSGRQ